MQHGFDLGTPIGIHTLHQLISIMKPEDVESPAIAEVAVR